MRMDERSQRVRERIVVTVYTIYTIAMTAAAFMFHWASWVVPVIVGGAAVCVAMSVKNYKTYKYRAWVTTIMAWMNFPFTCHTAETSPGDSPR